MRATVLALTLLLGAPALASADALPGCDDGEHLETNPVEPGAMHHNGGQCVSDGGCSVSHARSGEPAFVFGFVAAAGAMLRLRKRS